MMTYKVGYFYYTCWLTGDLWNGLFQTDVTPYTVISENLNTMQIYHPTSFAESNFGSIPQEAQISHSSPPLFAEEPHCRLMIIENSRGQKTPGMVWYVHFGGCKLKWVNSTFKS